jgi:hypothetical protein
MSAISESRAAKLAGEQTRVDFELGGATTEQSGHFQRQASGAVGTSAVVAVLVQFVVVGSEKKAQAGLGLAAVQGVRRRKAEPGEGAAQAPVTPTRQRGDGFGVCTFEANLIALDL